MLKDVLLKLSSVKYSGKSIGDDIRIEIDTLGHILTTDKQIKNGTAKKINKNLIRFPIIQKSSFTLPIEIKIIEKDTVFNDVGRTKAKIKIGLSSSDQQKSTHRVEVLESRWKFVKPKAVFDVTLEVKVIDAIRYIEEAKEGFLVVKNESGEKVSLPAFLKVRYEYSEAGRDYFTLLEGVHKEQKMSVKIKEDGTSFLHAENQHTGPIYMTYSLSVNELKIKKKNYETIDSHLKTLKKGKYDIGIPDAPHKVPDEYLEIAPKAKVWFHIGHDYVNDKEYIHTGQRTAGCITLKALEQWDEVYKILIRARKGDSMSVGILEVIN